MPCYNFVPNIPLVAEMWPEQRRRPSTTTDSPKPRSRVFALDDDEDVRTQGQLPVFGSALQGPGIPVEDLIYSNP